MENLNLDQIFSQIRLSYQENKNNIQLKNLFEKKFFTKSHSKPNCIKHFKLLHQITQIKILEYLIMVVVVESCYFFFIILVIKILKVAM